MFFLLRMAFWLGLVLILLPSGSGQRSPSPSDVGAAAAFSAASATVHDLGGFCTREPDACTVGAHLAGAIADKAQAGAKMLYDFLTEARAPRQTGSLAGGRGRSAPGMPAVQPASQNTLTPADLRPAWRGPAARADAKHTA